MNPFHRHRFEIINAKQLNDTRVSESCPRRFTRYLLVCRCGDVKSEEVFGHWTLEELRGGRG